MQIWSYEACYGRNNPDILTESYYYDDESDLIMVMIDNSIKHRKDLDINTVIILGCEG